MLSKKILSLSLAAGLAISASSNTFALGGQSEVAPLPSATECSTEIRSNIITLLAIPACRAIFLTKLVDAMINSPVSKAYFQKLEVFKQLKHHKYTRDVQKLTEDFCYWYDNDAKFRKVVADALVKDANGINKHSTWTGF